MTPLPLTTEAAVRSLTRAQLVAMRIQAERECGVGPEIWKRNAMGHFVSDDGADSKRRAVLIALQRRGLPKNLIGTACGVSKGWLMHAMVPIACKPALMSPTHPVIDHGGQLTAAFAEGVREAWLLFAAFEEPAQLDAVLFLIDDDARRIDPEYQSPAVIREGRGAA